MAPEDFNICDIGSGVYGATSRVQGVMFGNRGNLRGGAVNGERISIFERLFNSEE